MIQINGENGTELEGRYGEPMKYLFALIFSSMLASVHASSLEVHLPRVVFANSGTGLMLHTEKTNRCELPDPLFELGEPRTNILEKIAALDSINTVVAATIEEVIPIAITGLEYYYLNDSSPLFWYRIKCGVNKIVRGDFPASSMEFVATHRGNRHTWQFVRGHAFYFGLIESEKGWEIKQYFRSSPIPPYRIEDYICYFKMRRENPSFDWSQSDEIIKNAEENVGRWCRDASVVKSNSFILTFDGNKLWDNMNLDYGISVTILTNEWKYPLPNNYIP